MSSRPYQDQLFQVPGKYQSIGRTFSLPCSEGHQLDDLDEEDEDEDVNDDQDQPVLKSQLKNQAVQLSKNSHDRDCNNRKSSLIPNSQNETITRANTRTNTRTSANFNPNNTGNGTPMQSKTMKLPSAGNGQFGLSSGVGAGGCSYNCSGNNNVNDRARTRNSLTRDREHEEGIDFGSHILDEFSVDLPSDFPSGLVDIEGNLIGDIRFGHPEDDEDTNEHDHGVSYGEYENDNDNENDRVDLDKLIEGQVDQDQDLDEEERERKLSVISNGQVFTHGRGYHLHNHCNRHKGVGRDNSTSAQSNSSASTITQHYYPEGGWGWIVLVTAVMSHLLMCGMNLCAGLIMWAILGKFGNESKSEAGWLGAMSVGISLLLSPIWVSICKRKSTRLAAVFGGLVAALGCLFTSFATQLHQIYFSYATILGVGVGLTRDASSLMVGQYFKRKRDMVEIIVVAASGLGILLMSILINNAINSFGWRLGLQAVTGCLFICFFLGTCYRSASLYHPQRRAILHLKNQKRKIKDKEKRDDKPPFVDCSSLRSKTVQILLLSSATTAFGIYTPIFFLAIEFHENLEELAEHVNMSLVYIYVGVAWMLGCLIFGILIVQKSKDCRVSKQYLCQVAGVICSISIVTFTIVNGQSGLIIFCCIYGFSLGGYNYALKIHTYERVRARHFPRAWSFIQASQAIPLFLGVPITGYINNSFPGWRAGYYLSAAMVFLGSLALFLTDVRRRRLSRRKSHNSSTKTCETSTEKASSPKLRRLSFAFPVEPMSPESKHEPTVEDGDGNENIQDGMDPSVLVKELTCISEEAIADMNFQDIYYEEWDDFFGRECITSCNKVEACLASEFQPDCSTIFQRKLQTISRPGLHAGLVGTAAAVAHGVASMGMGSGARFPLTLQEQEFVDETHDPDTKAINKNKNPAQEDDSRDLVQSSIDTSNLERVIHPPEQNNILASRSQQFSAVISQFQDQDSFV